MLAISNLCGILEKSTKDCIQINLHSNPLQLVSQMALSGFHNYFKSERKKFSFIGLK